MTGRATSHGHHSLPQVVPEPSFLDSRPVEVRPARLDLPVLEGLHIRKSFIDLGAVLLETNEPSPARSLVVDTDNMFKVVFARGEDAFVLVKVHDAVYAAES